MIFTFPLLGGSIILLASLVSSSPAPVWTSTETIQPSVVNGISDSILTSMSYGLDSPKITPINSTSWDWWYFDVVSEDAQSSLVVVFYTAPETAFDFSGAPTQSILEASLALNFPGLPEPLSINGVANNVPVVTVGNGASGEWTGTGFSFDGSPDMRLYTVNIEDEKLGVKGSITYQSVAPAHYPCGCVEAGQPLESLPTIGWANALPDAVSNVDLTINGTKVMFSGAGYHDKNWGTQPFTSAVGSWYWGHGRLGPYSIVWFDALSPDGTESVSAYVSNNQRVIASQCPGLKVRPLGNATYPPKAGSAPPAGFSIEIDLGDSEGELLIVNTTNAVELESDDFYHRWSGELSGGFQGQKQLTGNALYEEFQLFQ